MQRPPPGRGSGFLPAEPGPGGLAVARFGGATGKVLVALPSTHSEVSIPRGNRGPLPPGSKLPGVGPRSPCHYTQQQKLPARGDPGLQSRPLSASRPRLSPPLMRSPSIGAGEPGEPTPAPHLKKDGAPGVGPKTSGLPPPVP